MISDEPGASSLREWAMLQDPWVAQAVRAAATEEFGHAVNLAQRLADRLTDDVASRAAPEGGTNPTTTVL
jgi:hypothetical protein